MRKVAVVLIALIATASFGQMTEEEHLEHLRAMMHAMSQHGPVIPQPENLQPTGAVAINITAKSFQFTPSTFTVNQGDVVTLTVTVPSNDPSSIGHGVLMDTYIDPGLNCGRGKTVSKVFTATTPGTFAFVCTQPTCGAGHTSMIGMMIVNAAPQGPAINSIAPASGTTSGGTAVTITGSGFQPGATVAFGGVAAKDVHVVNSSTITATTPVGPASEELQVDVIVTNPDDTSATLHPGFSYTQPSLSVTGISPSVNFIAGGGTVTIVGEGFSNAVASSVSFGGVAATNVTIDSPISMHVTLPAHTAGTVDVVVTVGSSTVTKSASFTYQAIPSRHHASSH